MPEYTFSIDLAVDPANALQVSTGVSLAVTMASGVFFPAPWSAECALVEPGNDLVPPLGGQAQRLSRLGARWRVTFSSLPALGADKARGLLALRAKARANGSTMVFQWPQPQAVSFGAPTVNGAGQLGTSLICVGLTNGVTIPAGTVFSFQAGGRINLACTTAAVTASGGGAATLSFAPMLRASPASGAALEFISPAIEGYIQGRSEDWSLQKLAWVGLPSFSVLEAVGFATTTVASKVLGTEAGAILGDESGGELGLET